MNLMVKTLKGGKFVVEVEGSNTVAEVKNVIEGTKSELTAANMKLIHSGKVLKDDVTIDACNIKPNDFLVCMITKAKKAVAKPAAVAAPAAAATPAPAPATTSTTSTESSTPAAAATPAPATPAPAPATTSTTPPPAPAPASSAPAPAAPPSDEFPAEIVSNLTSMGFPEAEVRACLRAAHGNPDVAVEFLMNGIPPLAAAAASSSSTEPLAALRSHPQFDALRRLVQSNPSTLQAVLTQIGQQQPELLQEINANQATFIQMMNEPISDTPSAPPPAPSSSTATPSSRSLENMTNPAQMAQMLSNLNPSELNEMAAMMGIAPEQLQAMAQMIGQMGNQEQFQEYMMQALQSGGGGGGGSGGGGGAAAPHILRLTEEEMAAVDRLTEMGFDRAEAAQAFLACDKNEALAANLLMDSAGEGGFGGFGGGGGGGNGGDGNGEGENNGDDGEDMYD